jgi:hypothetical protein
LGEKQNVSRFSTKWREHRKRYELFSKEEKEQIFDFIYYGEDQQKYLESQVSKLAREISTNSKNIGDIMEAMPVD